MKLLSKINRKYAMISGLISILGIILIFIFIKYYISSEMEEKLSVTEYNVQKNLINDYKIEFKPFIEVKELSNYSNANLNLGEKDTLLRRKHRNDLDSYRQKRSIYRVGDKLYLITVRADNVEQFELIISIGLPIVIILLILIITMNIMTRKINISIWSPFYKNLDILKKFSVIDKNKVELVNSEINEFKDMNNSIIELTEKIKADYNKLKEFSENASHELQTPVAIIKTKIESMLQNEQLEKEAAVQLQSMYQTVNRLSRLNKSLTLLTKLESIEFEDQEEISLRDFILLRIEDFKEFAKAKSINIKMDLQEDALIFINKDQLEILFSNLLTNAINHNYTDGEIFLLLNKEELIIENTGKPLLINTERVFERFIKNDPAGESTGLGLTIVKRICELNQMEICYNNNDSIHNITVKFNSKSI
jgi:signal transduction histidine kinase